MYSSGAPATSRLRRHWHSVPARLERTRPASDLAEACEHCGSSAVKRRRTGRVLFAGEAVRISMKSMNATGWMGSSLTALRDWVSAGEHAARFVGGALQTAMAWTSTLVFLIPARRHRPILSEVPGRTERATAADVFRLGGGTLKVFPNRSYCLEPWCSHERQTALRPLARQSR